MISEQIWLSSCLLAKGNELFSLIAWDFLMTNAHPRKAPTRRQLLTRIGTLAGSAALYQAMTTLGHAMGTDFRGPPQLSGAKPGTRVLVLGAGLSGMLSAYELRKAGYKVQILEFQSRSGGIDFLVAGCCT